MGKIAGKYGDFWSKVEKQEDGCWLWKGSCNKDGYGMVKINKKGKKAHRISYEQFYGTIPEKLYVCHHCDIPNCVNPDHLFLGTQFDNMKNMRDKKRDNYVFGEKHSSKLTNNQVLEIVELLKEGKSECYIANIYKVCQATIGHIRVGRTWTKITGIIKTG